MNMTLHARKLHIIFEMNTTARHYFFNTYYFSTPHPIPEPIIAPSFSQTPFLNPNPFPEPLTQIPEHTPQAFRYFGSSL